MIKRLVLLLFVIISFGGISQDNGNELFDESFVHEVRITFEQENFWDSLEYYYTQYSEHGAAKQYMVASVKIDGTVVDSVGVRQKGFFSNWGSPGLKEPLKIDFNEYVPGQRYDGLKKINLQNGFQDPSMMRDALAYKFMRDAGVAAPRSSYAKVYLNDTYWGLYILVEQVDDRFLKNWFDNNDGNLFKCIDNTNLDWQGENPADYKDEFELKTNEELDDWSEFIDLVDKINKADEFKDSISTQLQMNNYTRILAADVLMYNWDSYYEHGRNFYVYFDSSLMAFQWIPWDYNLSFSESPTNILIEYTGWESIPKPLVIGVMNNELYREMYFNHLCIMIEHYFTLENLGAWIDSTKELIKDDLDEDPNKYFTTEQFITSVDSDVTITDEWGATTTIPGIKSFIAGRYSTVSSQLSSHDHSCTALSLNEEESRVMHSIYPNPSATGFFTIQFAEEVDHIQIYSMYGQVVHQEVVTEGSQMTLDLSHLSSGIYIVELSGASKSQIRVVKQ